MNKLVVSEATALKDYNGTGKTSGKPYTVYSRKCKGSVDGVAKDFIAKTLDKTTAESIQAGWSGEGEFASRTASDGNTYTHYDVKGANRGWAGKGGGGGGGFRVVYTPKEFDELWGHAIKAVQQTIKVFETDEPIAGLMQAYMGAAVTAGVKLSAPATVNNAPMKNKLIETVKEVIKKHDLGDLIDATGGINDDQLLKMWNDCGGGEMVFVSRIKAECSAGHSEEPAIGSDEMPF